MNKRKVKKIIEYLFLCMAFIMIIINCHNVKADVTTLQQDEKGRYCINTADDYYFFLSKVNKAPYRTSAFVLTNDIEITN